MVCCRHSKLWFIKVQARLIKSADICNLPSGNKLYHAVSARFVLSYHKVMDELTPACRMSWQKLSRSTQRIKRPKQD
jgi:hypothetical protein